MATSFEVTTTQEKLPRMPSDEDHEPADSKEDTEKHVTTGTAAAISAAEKENVPLAIPLSGEPTIQKPSTATASAATTPAAATTGAKDAGPLTTADDWDNADFIRENFENLDREEQLPRTGREVRIRVHFTCCIRCCALRVPRAAMVVE